MVDAIAPDGSVVDVPADELASRWREGTAQPVAGAKYHIQMPDGSLYEQPSETLGDALHRGAVVLDPSQVAARQAARDYGGAAGLAIAGAGGAAEQGTFGLSGYLLPKSWLDAIAAAERVHPVATMVGQVAGGLASSVATGGGIPSLVGHAGEAIAAPLLEEGGTAARIVGRAAVKALEGSAEGAQFGAARLLSEHGADPDHAMTAQHILSEVGGDALWGAGLSSGMSFLKSGAGRFAERAFGNSPEAARTFASGVAKESSRQTIEGLTEGAGESVGEGGGDERLRVPKHSALGLSAEGTAAGELSEPGQPGQNSDQPSKIDRALSDARSASAKDVATVAGRAMQTEPAEGLGASIKRWYARLAGAASGKSPEDIEAFTGGIGDEGSEAYQNRQRLLEADETRDEASRAIRAHVDEILKSSRDVMSEGDRTLKRSHIDALVTDVDRGEAAESVRNMWDQTASKLQEMMAAPDKYGGARPLANAWKVTREIGDKMESAITSGDIGEQYAQIDDLKKAIGKYTKGASRLSPGAAVDELVALQNRARASELQNLYETLRGGLEDEATWKGAGRAQREINAAWSKQIDASDRFHRALTTEIGRDPENPWVSVRGVDPSKADAYVRNLMNPAQDLTHKAVVDYVDSTRQLARSMAEQWELTSAKVAQVQRLEDAAKGFQDTLAETTKTLTAVNQFERLREGATGHGASFLAGAALIGHAVPGGLPAAMALHRASKIFTRPADAIMQLARVESMVRRSRGRVARSVRGFLSGTPKPAERLATSVYARNAARVARMASDPAATALRAQAGVADLASHNPGLAGQIVRTSLAGVHYLDSKLPPKPLPDPLDPRAEPPEPSDYTKAAWLRSYRAVTDPHSVLADLQAGRMSVEGVEALQQVYPDMYADVRKTVADELAKGRTDVTRQQRLGLSMLLSLPSPSTSPEYVQQRQAAYATSPQPEPPQGKPPGTSRRSKPMNLAVQQSPADRVESGGSQT